MIHVVPALEKPVKSLAKCSVLAMTTLALAGCSALVERMPWSQASKDDTNYSLISSNLIDAMSQYPKLSPLLATVQVTEPDSDFEAQVHDDMLQMGFKLETVSDEKGANAVSAIIKSQDDATTIAPPLFVLSVGDISAERQFVTVGGKTMPASEMVIRGADERTITLNDEQLFPDADSAFRKVAFQPYNGPTIADMLRPPVLRSMVENASETRSSPLVKENMYETLESNFSSLYADYEDVDQSVLIFPNDSLVLGDANKQIIEEYVELMDPETDVLSVIGCSHGQTEISNGNSLLALGRANRVKEAFLFSGVTHEKVMDEGCWAPRTFDEVMPRRGVVLTLKRRKDS